jgi:hypothetical protein
MKKQIMTMAILLGCLIAAGASHAQAQTLDPIKADIPFDFYVGEKLLPAGEYTITEKHQGLMEIQRDDGKATAFFMTDDNQPRQEPTASELIFNRYGNETFLSRVEEQGNPDEAMLLKSKLEKQAERNESEENATLLSAHN